MASRTVHLNQTARNDLRQLMRYLVENGADVRVARRFAARIEADCHKLAYFPHRGIQRNDIRPGLRLLPIGRRSVIAYTIDANAVRITNVFHAGQDFEVLLRNP